jgi:teichuronic acid exporter
MINSSVTKLLANGISWNLFARIFSNGCQLVIYFVLARLLTPTDFGIIAILLVFVNISNIFAIAGLGAAIIQADKYDKDKFDTIYIISGILGILVCFVLFISAPFIARFYSSDYDLAFLIRISTPAIIFNSINSIQTSILQRELNFKGMFVVTSLPILISGIISICFAYFGFGVYSLIVNNLFGSLISVIFCFLFYLPFPKLIIKLNHAKHSLNYSYKILISAIIDEITKGIFILSIGKYYNNKSLGNYNLGRQIPGFASATLNSTIASVFFPYYSKSKMGPMLETSQIYRKIMRLLNLIIFPVISIVVLISNLFIEFFFTPKWYGSEYYLNMFSVILGIHHLHTKITYYINAIGHSEITLKYESIKKMIGIIVLVVTLPISVKAVVLGQLIVAVFSILIMFYPTKKYLNISFNDQFKDIFPLLFLNASMFLVGLFFKTYFDLGMISLFLFPFVYLIIYFLCLRYFGMNSYKDLLSLKKHINI